MDKRTIIGIILIILITLLMPIYQKWIIGDKNIQKIQKPQISSSESPISPEVSTNKPDSLVTRDTTRTASFEKPESRPAPLQGSEEVKNIDIETQYLNIKLSTANGGNLVSWELKKYGLYSGGNVNLINDNGLDLHFLNADGEDISLTNYNLFSDFDDGEKALLSADHPELEIKFYLPIKNGRILKTLRFYNDRYSFDATISFEDLGNYIINRKYYLSWFGGLPSTEENLTDDNSYTKAFAYLAEDIEALDAGEETWETKDFNGRVDWVGCRTKYFLTALVPADANAISGASLSGQKQKIDDHDLKSYNVGLEVNYIPQNTYSQNFTIYLGPLDHQILKRYDSELQKLVMNKDWYERLFRPISLLIIPAFKFLYRFVPNYGVVIIVFSILVKLLLYPLTKKSYQSMSEMQYLQPKMAELREKYKSEPQRLNKEMMKLYKEHNVNPMGGCLPMLLQMPLLFSLFIVFRSTIQLRGEPFILWITDLSRPDVLNLGFSLPIIGNNIHVLPIIMAITMIWQSKVSMTDPKQKMMIYFMPVFLMFVFYSLPSGLNLYYALFNTLSMFQTARIKKKMHPGKDNNQMPQTTTKSTKKVRNKK